MLNILTLKQLFWSLTSGIALLVLLTSLLFFQLYSINNEIHGVEKLHSKTISVSRTLKQSSDDLTKFARLYAVTGKAEYLDNFYHVLNIRNGVAPRPHNYDQVYWDLSLNIRNQRHPPNRPVSLQQLLIELNLSELEKSKLLESERQSNQLVELEEEAFNALKGLYKDSEGKYTIRKEPDRDYAIQLLHSESYLKAKHDIMLPIDEFYEIVERRLLGEEKALIAHQRFLFQLLAVIFTLLIILLVVMVVCVNKNVLQPIHLLKNMINEFKDSHRVKSLPKFNNDEIGTVAKDAYMMMELIRVNTNALKKIAYSDVLTRTHNRKYFFAMARKLLQVAERTQIPHAVIMLDLDFFKEVNDTHGHLVGDKVLTHTTKLISDIVRKGDVLARYGGEEFIILLPNAKLDDAVQIAEKIRKAVQETPVTIEANTLNITISIGVAECALHKSLEDNIQLADEALYRAKQNGRNRVEKAEAPGVPPSDDKNKVHRVSFIKKKKE